MAYPAPTTTLKLIMQVLLAWAVLMGCQLPGFLALLRFKPEAAPIQVAEGRAWAEHSGKRYGILFNTRQGKNLSFRCNPAACGSNGMSSAAATRVSWFVAPTGEFGKDENVPLSIEQGGRIVSATTQTDFVDLQWGLASMYLWLTQLALGLGLAFVFVRWRRGRARLAQLSREAAERRHAR